MSALNDSTISRIALLYVKEYIGSPDIDILDVSEFINESHLGNLTEDQVEQVYSRIYKLLGFAYDDLIYPKGDNV